MPGNTFGQLFRVTTWGESHGPAIGAVIDGCPPRLPLTEAVVQAALDLRRPGKGGPAETARSEPDRVEILSGVFEGRTTGTPISLLIWNRDARSEAYDALREVFRPGHGDITYQAKYGIRDHRGGGRASGRETAARVAAGAVAQVLLDRLGIRVTAYTVALGGVRARAFDPEAIETNRLFCPDPEAAARMEARVAEARAAGDSVGGVVEVRAAGVPAGLGEPVFGKLDGELAGALMSIGAVKGVEIGAGFRAAEMTGSEHNDPITPAGFEGNNAGGILAGISNGDELVIRAAVKPIPSIARPQRTVNLRGEAVELRVGGRHDASAIPRIVPVCQAMVRLVLADHVLRARGQGQAIDWPGEGR
ncbi:chorismate synthase [Dissulfurirhabdus thermomarina]|uniref:Chorismate synthase n=1 Tax=Dissulfurirhabdus thermomarina TaxID=1765737 RepID=A0A6N9TST3_DISTH|nr:chorismate synthase [Dissulfurirhabdus thermomarina]NDY42804.1 chorismate synthase [Dissulfurirhabdus thermomarina]NMX24388.1 chorismate synthase [Dissulfurirhabdus thermomarina]